MNTILRNQTYSQDTYNVPCDVMPEIALIILQARLSYELINVNENKREIVLGIGFQTEIPAQEAAIKNIGDILEEYNDLRYDDNDTTNWRM